MPVPDLFGRRSRRPTQSASPSHLPLLQALRRHALLCALVLMLSPAPVLAKAPEEPVRLCQTESPRYDYRMALTRLVLEKTARPGVPVVLQRYGTGPDPSQDRCLELLRSGDVDLVYLPPSPSRLADYAALPTDLYAGRLGYRLLLIRKEDAPVFADIQSIEQLRRMTGGFGRQWADLAVFEANRLPVVTGPGTDALLSMLKARRFDYLHRGVTEIYGELADYAGSDALMVEPRLALHYPLPVYFMTRPDRQPLLQRLQRGLLRVRQDGSWNRLIEQHMGRDWARAGIDRRRVLRLASPWPALAVPAGTP